MSGFRRPGRERLERQLQPMGRGWIRAALFRSRHLSRSIPAADSRVWGEIHRMLEPDAVLSALDEIEGFRPGEPDASLYTRVEIDVTFGDGPGSVARAWVYFYNAPLGRAQRIDSGDYLVHLNVTPEVNSR